MAEEEKSFWKTVPGIITGIATLITAVTGLIIAFNQSGWFKKEAPATEQTVSATVKNADRENGKSLSASTETASPSKEDFEVRFSMTDIKVDEFEYKILESTFEQINPNMRLLKIKLRMQNNSNYSPANFWNESFRLSIDEVLTPPSGDLNELVERHAAKDGFITFEVGNTAKNLVFIILNQGAQLKIPIELIKK